MSELDTYTTEALIRELKKREGVHHEDITTTERYELEVFPTRQNAMLKRGMGATGPATILVVF